MAVKSTKLLPKKLCDPDFIHKIVSWDQAEVEKFLTENGIHGCGFALAANSIDGKAFLNLDNQILSTWGIPIIKRSKIIALLNDLGSESTRKGVTISTQVRPKNVILCHNVTWNPTAAFPKQTSFCPAEPKTSKKTNLPVIPPKPQHLLRKPIPIQSFPEDETQKVEKTRGRYIQLPTNDSIAAGSEPESIHPENADIYTEIDEQSITRTINDGPCVSSDTTPNRRAAFREALSDGCTNESSSDDDRKVLTAGVSVLNGGVSSSNNGRMCKNEPSTNWFNFPEEKLTQGDLCGTPPLPPARNQDTSRCSSESNLSQSVSETRSSPLPTSRKTSMQSVTSLSSLAESLPSPPYSSRPIPTPPRRMIPVRRPCPAQSDPNPLCGNQIILPPNPNNSGTQLTSPAGSKRKISTDSEITNYPWFFNVDRKEAESLLRPLGNGTFLIRPSKHGGANALFTLSLQYNNRVFHVLIRSRPDGKMALGSMKIEENCFNTLHELVELHYLEALQLHSGDKLAGTTRLSRWPTNIP